MLLRKSPLKRDVLGGTGSQLDGFSDLAIILRKY